MNFDIEEVVKAIDIPVDKWPGQCYGIALAMVEKGIVEGTAVYGHWLGRVHPKAQVFGVRYNHPFQQHGWVIHKDGETVIDPTRWVFENATPYIFVGGEPDPDMRECHCGHLKIEHEMGGFFRACNSRDCDCEDFDSLEQPWPYDEGGNMFRMTTLGPCPAFNPKKEVEFLAGLTTVAAAQMFIKHPPPWSAEQIAWLAHISPAVIGLPVVDLFRAICKLDLKAAIPLDNRRSVEREYGVEF